MKSTLGIWDFVRQRSSTYVACFLLGWIANSERSGSSGNSPQPQPEPQPQEPAKPPIVQSDDEAPKIRVAKNLLNDAEDLSKCTDDPEMVLTLIEHYRKTVRLIPRTSEFLDNLETLDEKARRLTKQAKQVQRRARATAEVASTTSE